MTSQGMNRDKASPQSQAFILLHNSVLGNRLPEIIDSHQAMSLVRSAGVSDERQDMALLRISERLHEDQELGAQVSAYWMTEKGLLIHGTENAAYRLSNVFDIKGPAGVEAAPAEATMFPRGVSKAFKGSVEEPYTARLGKIAHIANIYSFAARCVEAAANEPRFSNKPAQQQYAQPVYALAA